jgi:methyl-accepting chemotaxis protein
MNGLLERIEKFNQAVLVILKIPLTILGCVALAALALVLWDTHNTINTVNTNLPGTFAQLNDSLKKVSDASDTLKSTLQQTTATLGSINSSVGQFGTVITKMDDVLDHINMLCTPEKGHVYTADEDKPCGTLADIARTLHTIRGTFGTIEIAGNHIDKSLTTYDAQETELVASTNTAIVNLGSTLDYAHQMMVAHQQLLDNLQRLAGNSADTMQEAYGVAKDIHQATTKMNTPKTKEQKILEWAPVGVKAAISVACMVTGAC